MMFRIAAVLFITAAFLWMADKSHAQQTVVVQSCGTLPNPNQVGSTGAIAIDVNGKLCSSSAGNSVIVPSLVCDGSTDNSAVLNAAFSTARAASASALGATIMMPTNTPNRCAITQTVNCTGITNKGIVFEGNGTPIQASVNGAPAFDCLGSKYIIWNNLNIIGSGVGFEPTYLFQMGRTNTAALNGGGAGMQFNNLHLQGKASICSFYNFSGEDVGIHGSSILNSDTGTGQALCLDGYNHFNITSAFVTESAPVDTAQSFNGITVESSEFTTSGAATQVSPLWIGGTRQLRVKNSYVQNTLGPNCVTLYSEAGSAIYSNYFDLHCEGAGGGTNLTDVFLVSGSVVSPTFYDFTYIDWSPQATNSLFKLDAGGSATSANFQGLNLRISQVVPTGTKVFDAPTAWSASGCYYLAIQGVWNNPAVWNSTCENVGLTSTPPRYGPCDILGGCDAAYSCSRLLRQAYTGALCNWINETTTATLDIYPKSDGSADINALAVFCAGATCKLVTAYDQSGNAVNATQGTDANRPTVVFADTSLGNRLALGFGDAGAINITATAAASINNIFATGGYIGVVVHPTGVPTQQDRFWEKGVHRLEFAGGGSSLPMFSISAATSAGTWFNGSITAAGHIVDVTGTYAQGTGSLANIPTLDSDGATLLACPTNCTQPVGSIASDAASNLTFGSNAAAGGTRGFPGNMAEWIIKKSIPTARVLDAVRRNQGWFYGLTGVL